MRRLVPALGVTLLAAVVLAKPSAAAEAPPAPEATFVGHDKPVLRFVDDGRLATVTALLSNGGTADLETVEFVLLQDGAGALEACGVEELTTGASVRAPTCSSKPEPVTVPVGATKRFLISFELKHGVSVKDPLIEARSMVPGVSPTFAEMTVTRILSNHRIWWPVWGAIAAAGIFAAFGAYATRDAVNREPPKTSGWGPTLWHWATAKIFTAAAWSFSGSWATSVAALGGLLGTVLAATGFFTEVFPGVSAGRFTGFSIVFGALAVLAPIAYTALGRRDETLSISVGTVAGLLVASAVTIAAIGGQVTALALLVQMSDASSTFRRLCLIGLAAGMGLVIVYAARSARWLSLQCPPTPAASDTELAQGTESVLTLRRGTLGSTGVP